MACGFPHQTAILQHGRSVCQDNLQLHDPRQRFPGVPSPSRFLNPRRQPLFRVVADDLPDEPFEGTAPSSCWVSVMKRVNSARAGQAGRRLARSLFLSLKFSGFRQHASVSGPEYFGITNPMICELISRMPGAQFLISKTACTFCVAAFISDPYCSHSHGDRGHSGHRRLGGSANG